MLKESFAYFLKLYNFLNYLDTTVGKGNYLIFLTADHACAENGNFMHNEKYDVKNSITSNKRQFLITLL